MNWCIVLLVILLPAGTLAQTCGSFSVNRSITFDLSSLTSRIGYTANEYSVANPSQVAYVYAFNFCQDEYIYNTSVPVSNLWAVQCNAPHIPSSCMPVGTALEQIVYQNNEVVITYVNKECCMCKNKVFRTFNIHLVCNTSAETPNIGNVTENVGNICTYDVTVQTAAVCPGIANTTECCLPHSSSGCDDTNMQECVCKSTPYCCTSGWNSTCVSLVESLGCGSCLLGPCCVSHVGLGCEDRQLSKCVCEKMSNCCTSAWNNQCVAAVNKFGCGECQAACCNQGECSDPQVRECVCSRDMYCCATQWDATCVAEAKQFNCTYCPPSTPHYTLLPRPLHYSLLE